MGREPLDASDFQRLPERTAPEDLVCEKDVAPPSDSSFGGRDPERDWMLRYAS